MPLKFDAERIVSRTQGREGWSREGKRQLEQHRWRHPDPIRRSRPERLLLAAERLEGELDVARRANEAYERYRVTARDRLGRRPGGRPDPFRPPELPAGKVNVTDPDSRSIPLGVRVRAQIGNASRTPSSAKRCGACPPLDMNANRVWMTAVICALNLAAMLCELSPLAGASGTAPAKTPLRRHAKTLRRALLCVPARINRHARQTILPFAAGYRHLDAFEATWAAAYALPPP